MRSPRDFELIRAANGSAMGMGDAGDDASNDLSVLGSVVGAGVGVGLNVGQGGVGAALGVLGPLTVASAFPQVSWSWDPSSVVTSSATPGAPAQPAPATGSSSWLGDWLNQHVIRPEFTWGPVRYAPGDGFADYSVPARFVAWGTGLAVVGGILWILVRAFSGRRGRANPHRYSASRYRRAA